jgi:hypothetical protein
MRELQNSGDPEWFTPKRYIAAVKRVLGQIDLDPAFCEEANRIVGATRYYTKELEGSSTMMGSSRIPPGSPHEKLWRTTLTVALTEYLRRSVPLFNSLLLPKVAGGTAGGQNHRGTGDNPIPPYLRCAEHTALARQLTQPLLGDPKRRGRILDTDKLTLPAYSSGPHRFQ